MKKKKQKKSSAAKSAVTAVAGIFAAGAVLGGLFGEAPEETAVDPSPDTAYSETLEEFPSRQTLELPEPEIEAEPEPEELPEPEIPEIDYSGIDVSVQSEKAMADDLKALGLFKGASDTDIEEIYVPEPDVIETLVLPEPTIEAAPELLAKPEPIPEPAPIPEPVPEPVILEPVTTPEPEPVVETPPVKETPVYVEPNWNTETGQTLRLEWVSSPVGKNETATLAAIGKPNTEYSISVYYSSGASTADGLEKHTSDSSGNVSWSWKVGGRTKSGSHRIVISGGGETLETSFTTTD